MQITWNAKVALLSVSRRKVVHSWDQNPESLEPFKTKYGRP